MIDKTWVFSVELHKTYDFWVGSLLIIFQFKTQ